MICPPRIAVELKAGRDDRRGSVAILAGLLCVPLFGIAALVLDLGLNYVMDTQLQAGTDAAALAAVLALNRASAVASSSIASNGLTTGATLTVTTGTYCPDPGITAASGVPPRFINGTCPVDKYNANVTGTNAVKVVTTATSPVLLGSVLSTLETLRTSATAVATRIDVASFSAGSGLLSLNTADSTAFNAVLGGLFGTSVNLSAVSYNGLIDANVDALSFLNALASQASISGGTYASLANANVTVGEVIAAEATALNQSPSTTNSAAAAALTSLASQLPANTPVPVSQLANLQPYLNDQIGTTNATDPAALQAGFNAYSLIGAIGQIAGAGNTLNVPTGATPITLSTTVGGTASLSFTGTIIQPVQTPIFGFGPVGTTVTMAQATIGATITVQNPSLGVPGLLGVTLTIPLSIKLASGTATLSAISCPASANSVMPTMTIAVMTQAAQVALGTLAGGPATPAHPVQILSLTVAGVAGGLTASANTASGSTSSQNVTFTLAQTEQTPPTPMRVSSNASLLSSASTSLGSSLSFQPTGALALPINALTLAALEPAVRTAVTAELAAADAPVDAALSDTLNAVGLQLGYIDIYGNGIRCGLPVLVQ